MEIATALINKVSELIESSRQKVAASVNAELTLLYWRIGRLLQSEIATGGRADYGKQVVAGLSSSLTQEYGRGWGKRQLHYCIRLSEAFPEEIVHTVCAQLSWSHLRLLVSMDEPVKRAFYLQMATTEHWSVRQLNERIQSMLFERTAISRKPEETIELELAKLQDQQLSTDLILKDPYLLDFLGLNDHYLEKDLEDAILRELEQFLLELGSGFTFVARQKRLQIDDDDFYLDLLFYNRKLKRLVAIELKIGDFRPEYKGQMELYLRWLARHEQEPSEEAPIGIILCAGKKQEQIELLELDKSGIHVAEYLTVLPPRDILQARFRRAIETAQLSMEAKDLEK
ncbi:MAG: DUF1016 family protein [Candidatus Eremiobacteraeota bacterium]|nr:DUF1016 family protein [Candidatus Eremiobacteraeota bacterium]MCW5866613.1 DUF1016 family protein [Candidatus Eremiobacteraeota bacterium]